MPQVEKRIDAAYPEEAKERGVEGRVILRMRIGPDGGVQPGRGGSVTRSDAR